MDANVSRAVKQLKKFSVCQLGDAMPGRLALETEVRPLDQRFRTCGPALTVECAAGDNLTLHHALHLAKPGDVLVVTAPSSIEAALWGELMSIAAKSRRLAGTVVDGWVRDLVELQGLRYPVFSRGMTPCRAKKESYGRINVPVHLGKLRICPGDLVLGDANGITSVNLNEAEEAVRLASEIADKEKRIKEQIRSGRSTFEILQLQPFVTSGSGESSLP